MSMTSEQMTAEIDRQAALAYLRLCVADWDSAVASGSIDAQLAAGRKLADAARDMDGKRA